MIKSILISSNDIYFVTLLLLIHPLKIKITKINLEIKASEKIDADHD